MLEGVLDTKYSVPSTRVGRGAASPRWRSTGWTPLAYPCSAIFAPAADAPGGSFSSEGARKSRINPHFPLHKDVILAAARELLVLDGSVDGRTLTVVEDSDAVAYHIDSAATSDKQGKKRKRSDLYGEAPSGGKKYLRRLKACDAANSVGGKVECLDEKARKVPVLPAAEELACAVLKRVIAQAGNKDEVQTVASSVVTGDYTVVGNKPPRKVSDADIDSIGSASNVSPSLPPSLTVLISNGYYPPSALVESFLSCSENPIDLHSCALSTSEQIPPLLDVSISVEAYLRQKAYEMTKQMASSFDERPLREFLGYKSSSLKRDRVLQVMSDFLFDVSHAMFAWEQTEREILIEYAEAPKTLPPSSLLSEELESKVRDALFDHRALKKIGGFDPSSLLPHALSINRVRNRGMSWKEFAATGTGRKMLRHHREGNAALVGQKRRGQRPRNRNGLTGSNEEERGIRSRSSSITSVSDASECQNEKLTCNMSCHNSDDVSSASLLGNTSFNIVPDLIPLTLKREKGKSWGIKLAKEGTMCVVDQAPGGSTSRESLQNGKVLALQSGDLIVSIRNERGESACSPSSSALQGVLPMDGCKLSNNSQDWFRDAVNLFKTSNTLRLEVRRVNPMSVLP